MLTSTEKWIFKKLMTLKVRASLYGRIADFLQAKIPLNQTLLQLRNRYRRQLSLGEQLRMRFDSSFQPKGDFRAQVLSEWLEGLGTGQKFNEVIREWVPPNEHMLILAGERGASLPEGLRNASGMSEANTKIKKAIIGKSVQPAVLLLALFGMFMLFQRKIAPIFLRMKPLETWGASARRLYDISYFLDHYSLLTLGLLVVFSYGLLLTLPRWTGVWRQRFDALPPWSIYRVQNASSFLIGLASLLNAKVPMNVSLQMMHRNSTAYMQWHLERMMNILASGVSNQGVALNTGLLDSETAGDVEDFSQIISFSESIQEVGQKTLTASLERIDAVMGAMQTMMLLLVAGCVMWIYSTTYLMMTDLANSATNTSAMHGG